jgi:hypothetical protein
MSPEPRDPGFSSVVEHDDVVRWVRFALGRMDPRFETVFDLLSERERTDLAMKLFTGTVAELADDLARRCGFTGSTGFRVFSQPDGGADI